MEEMAWETCFGFWLAFSSSFCRIDCCLTALDLTRVSLGEIIRFVTANLRVFFAFPIVAVSTLRAC